MCKGCHETEHLQSRVKTARAIPRFFFLPLDAGLKGRAQFSFPPEGRLYRTSTCSEFSQLANLPARKCYSTGQKARGDLPCSLSAIGVSTTRGTARVNIWRMVKQL